MIDPAQIPRIDGDLREVYTQATRLAAVGGAIGNGGAGIDSDWQALASVYHAPEASELMSATNPVRDQSQTTADHCTTVAGALHAYVNRVQPIQSRLESLRAEAIDFVASAHKGWQADPDKIHTHNHLVAQVDAAVAEWMAAQRDCANRINNTACGINYRPDDGKGALSGDEFGVTAAQLDDEAIHGELPWGSSEERTYPFWKDPKLATSHVGIGLATGAYRFGKGLLSLEGVLGPHQFTESWRGMGATALAGNPQIVKLNDQNDFLVWKKGEIGKAGRSFSESVTAYDDWQTDPGKALGENIFTILTVVPTEGLGEAGALGKAGIAGDLSRLRSVRASEDTAFDFESVEGAQGESLGNASSIPTTDSLSAPNSLLNRGAPKSPAHFIEPINPPRRPYDVDELPQGSAYELWEQLLTTPPGISVCSMSQINQSIPRQ